MDPPPLPWPGLSHNGTTFQGFKQLAPFLSPEAPRSVALHLRAVPPLLRRAPARRWGAEGPEGSRLFFLLASLTSLPLFLLFPCLACPSSSLRILQGSAQVPPSPGRPAWFPPPQSPVAWHWALMWDSEIPEPPLVSSPSPLLPLEQPFRDTCDLVTDFLQILTTLKHGRKTIANSVPPLLSDFISCPRFLHTKA